MANSFDHRAVVMGHNMKRIFRPLGFCRLLPLIVMPVQAEISQRASAGQKQHAKRVVAKPKVVKKS
jgi:hypothetical protein